MASQSTVVNVFAESCKNGDTYGGLQTLKGVLHRKVRIRDEKAAQSLLVDAFRSVAVPCRSAEVASDLVVELFYVLNAFGHKGDFSGMERVRDIHKLFMDVPEADMSVEWCKAHVAFITNAVNWFESGKKSTASAGRADSFLFLQEALCNASVRLAHSVAATTTTTTARATTGGDGDGDGGGGGKKEKEEEICAALFSAYDACLCCAPNPDLIRSTVQEVSARLTVAERPFLIARTIYGLLLNASRNQAAAITSPSSFFSICAINTAMSLLEYEGMASVEDSPLHSFLHDVLVILKAAITTAGERADSSYRCKCVALIEALSKVYSVFMVPVNDLSWSRLPDCFLK